jgi:hypothetical protein
MIERLTAALDDRYRVTRELGAGGMATVYLAHERGVAAARGSIELGGRAPAATGAHEVTAVRSAGGTGAAGRDFLQKTVIMYCKTPY